MESGRQARTTNFDSVGSKPLFCFEPLQALEAGLWNKYDESISYNDVMSAAMYPKVFDEYRWGRFFIAPSRPRPQGRLKRLTDGVSRFRHGVMFTGPGCSSTVDTQSCSRRVRSWCVALFLTLLERLLCGQMTACK